MECQRDNFHHGVLLNGRFKTISPLNHGSFGMVFMATDLLTSAVVAIKCLTKAFATNDPSISFAVDERSEELACHKLLGSHPNIVNLIDSFETEAHIYLVLEFCSRGDLYEAIRNGTGPLETEHVREFMLQLVDAVSYIHSKGMYHRDIKPENIFLTYSGELKLGDFGLATSDAWTYETTVGSDRYMSPEQYDSAGHGYAPEKADIWAIGICLLNILFSRNPFTMPTERDPLFLDFSRDKQSLFDVFPTMSQDTYEVIAQCMSLDPSRRSLSSARDALVRAVSFTTFDEPLDEFCAVESHVGTTANREPLRTPSIQSPQADTGSFPWAKALHASPPQQFRQLSVIRDDESYHSEDLFPGADVNNKDWFSVGGKTPSTASVLDSTLGTSIQSMAARRPGLNPPRASLTPISGSLPITMSKAKPLPSIASVFGRKSDVVSKSWSDLWDEEEEEKEEEEEEEQLKARQIQNARTWSHESKAEDLETQTIGSSSLQSASAANNQKSQTESALTNDVDGDIVADGFFFHDTPTPTKAIPQLPLRYSPPSKRNAQDKWTALGERRRAYTGSSEPDKSSESWWKGRRNFGTGFYGFGTGFFETRSINTPKEKGKECPWREDNKSRGCQRSPIRARFDFGDLEWVGGLGHQL